MLRIILVIISVGTVSCSSKDYVTNDTVSINNNAKVDKQNHSNHTTHSSNQSTNTNEENGKIQITFPDLGNPHIPDISICEKERSVTRKTQSCTKVAR